MDAPKRLFPTELRCSARAFDRFMVKARRKHLAVVDTQGKPQVITKEKRLTHAQARALGMRLFHQFLAEQKVTNDL